MEEMKGSRWTARVKQENTAFEQEVSECATKQKIASTAKLFESYQLQHDNECSFTIEHGATKLRITLQRGDSYLLSWPDHKERQILIGDLDTNKEGYVVYTHDISKGGEEYEVVGLSDGKELWRFNGRQHGLASDVAILGQRVYLLEAHGPLQYKWLISLDLETGKDKRIHYNELRESVSLALHRGENGCLFLVCENSDVENLFHVKSNGKLEQLSPAGTSFVPIGYARGTTEPCYFVKRGSESRWKARGKALTEMKISAVCMESSIELCVLNCGLILYRKQGERYIESASCKREAKGVTKLLGEIHIHNWSLWYGEAGYTKPVEFTFIIPGKTPVKATYTLNEGLRLDKPKDVYGGTILTGMTTSEDGEKVRWLVSKNSQRKPKGLLMIGYGAYGMTTPFETTRWRPYIEADIAVAFALVRGGGDHTQEWADKGKLQGKLQGIQDFEACIRAVQDVLDVPPKATCIFGRSAGGFLVGGTVVRNPLGDLFSAVYTEAPYVDVLQTSANGDLPLTKFEYNEFGDPSHRIADFEFLLRLSPVGGLGPEGAPGILVLCKVGLNDRQVFAYESMKWIDALRGSGTRGAPKLLYCTKGYGHHVHGKYVYKERAEDFLILCKKLLE